MTTSCLLSNYNYARFVGAAIEGALQQTVPFDEIVVVDDGSTDGSFEVLTREYGRNPQVTLLRKAHEGQLSCFNYGAPHCTGDVIFFLDADDVYEPQYVERALSTYTQHPSCDFLFCGRRLFGKRTGDVLPFPGDRDFGYSVLQTMYLRAWIGAATSCLSMRRSVLEKILPLPFEDDWRVRADDCLVFGASLAGARKRYLAQPLVLYRVHERNHHHGKTQDPLATYRRRLAINRLFEHLERSLCFHAARLAEFHHREYCTIGSPTLWQLFNYAGIGLQAPISPLRRMACVGAMVRHYALAKWRDGAVSHDEAVQRNDPSRSAEHVTTLPFLSSVPAEDELESSTAQRSRPNRLAA
jgi:glycosyltransferase involved in cell wall biosynthesis